MVSPRRLGSRSLVVLALFLATNGLPRACLYAHHHAGGDHEHVHPWGDDAFTEEDHDDHDHVHAGAADDGPALEDPDGGHAMHFHLQAPFQHSARSAAPRLVRTPLVHSLPARLRLAAGVEPSPPAFARGPPSPASA